MLNRLWPKVSRCEIVSRGLLHDCKTLRNLHEGSFEALMNTGHVMRKSDSKIRNCLMGFNDTWHVNDLRVCRRSVGKSWVYSFLVITARKWILLYCICRMQQIIYLMYYLYINQENRFPPLNRHCWHLICMWTYIGVKIKTLDKNIFF